MLLNFLIYRTLAGGMFLHVSLFLVVAEEKLADTQITIEMKAANFPNLGFVGINVGLESIYSPNNTAVVNWGTSSDGRALA